jgi:hypothetical protein
VNLSSTSGRNSVHGNVMTACTPPTRQAASDALFRSGFITAHIEDKSMKDPSFSPTMWNRRNPCSKSPANNHLLDASHPLHPISIIEHHNCNKNHPEVSTYSCSTSARSKHPPSTQLQFDSTRATQRPLQTVQILDHAWVDPQISRKSSARMHNQLQLQ